MHLYWHQICRCIGRIHDAIVRGHGHFDNPSRSLSRPVVDQSVVHHFPGTKVQDVRPSRSIREVAFPRTNFLFVRSQRQRGSGAHIFRVGRGPQSPSAQLLHLFLRRSLVCLTPFLSQNAKKKKRICIMPSCDFLASFACARDQVRARIGLTMSTACWCCFRFRSSCYRT